MKLTKLENSRLRRRAASDDTFIPLEIPSIKVDSKTDNGKPAIEVEWELPHATGTQVWNLRIRAEDFPTVLEAIAEAMRPK